MNKLLIVKLDNSRKLYIKIYPEAEIVKNPVPILWNYKGSYFWVPVEIVKNEIIKPGIEDSIVFISLHQSYRLRSDVGKMLEELGK